MLPGRDRLREIAASPKGSLHEVPYAALLAALALEKRSCLALLRRKKTEKRLFFDGGVPVECLSNLLHETFGRYLVGHGRISEDEFAAAFARANVSGLRLGEVLVERGVLPREEAGKLLQQNLARKLLDPFAWDEGTWELVPDPPRIDAPPKVNAAQLIFTGVARFASQVAIDAAVGELVGKRLALNPSPPFPLEEVKLSEGQARVAVALQKRPRIDELALAAGLPFEEITRTLYALWLLGSVIPAEKLPAPAPSALRVVRPEETRPAALPAPPPPLAVPPAAEEATLEAPPVDPATHFTLDDLPAAPPAPAPPPVSLAARETGFRLAPERDLGRRREELRQAHDTHRAMDAFDLLGLADDAGEQQVLERFVEKARSWAPWTYEGHAQDARMATTLFAAAARAYAELADPRSREALERNRRITGQAVKSAPAPAQFFAIKNDVLDPEGQHRKGLDHLAAGRFKQALPLLELAAECDRQNGTWAAEAAWCRFLASDRKDPAKTLAAMQEAARIDPRAGLALHYAGELCRARGDLVLAEVYYRKAAKLLPGDRRPLDAIRALSRAVAR